MPLSQAPLTPAELRDALRPIREALQSVNRQILWDDRYGDVSQLVARAELMVIAARDATHRAEAAPINNEF